MKKMIQCTGAAYKKQSGLLSAATLDRAQNAITYRVFGCEKERQEAYEADLTAYEKSAIKANIWNTAMPPVYRVISMAGLLFILCFGQKNVLGTGWKSWSIAAFTTFLACFVKLSVKSSSAAKLFNAVHKAQVSWNRIKPLMAPKEESEEDRSQEKKVCRELKVEHVNFAYPDGKKILDDISFTAKKGEIIGITGSVACGKSTLGKVFLCEYPYEGSISCDEKELRAMRDTERTGTIGYLGHDPELFNDSVKNNILMGENKNVDDFLKAVCLDQEVAGMEDGTETLVGNGGVRLSGGQGQRLALARTLCHKKPVLILDDPFSALDKTTERQIFANLKELVRDNIVLLISHRLYLFPDTPLIQKEWVKPGTHFSCIGADMAGKEEIDSQIFEDAIVFVDDLEHCRNAGEIEIPLKQGTLSEDRICGELGDLILGKAAGRKSDTDITVFDSTGMALLDLAVADFLLKKNR